MPASPAAACLSALPVAGVLVVGLLMADGRVDFAYRGLREATPAVRLVSVHEPRAGQTCGWADAGGARVRYLSGAATAVEPAAGAWTGSPAEAEWRRCVTGGSRSSGSGLFVALALLRRHSA